MVTAPRRGMVFYPASHRYRLDGEWVPGVTTCIGVLEKPAIAKWAASQVAEYVADNREAVAHLYAAGRGPLVAALKEIPWQKRDDAATRGTTLHDFADKIIRGQDVDVPDALVPVVENTIRFMEDYDIEPVLVEAVVGSREYKYGGKLDLIANDAIWDYKSGKRIYESTVWQNCAYAFAEFHGEYGDEHPLPPVRQSYGVHIRADGYDVHRLEFGPHVFREFLVIREAYDINKRAKGNWKVPGSGYVGVAEQHEESVA